MSDIKPFLHPSQPIPDTSSITDIEDTFYNQTTFSDYITQTNAFCTSSSQLTLSKEDIQAMHESLKSDSQKIIEHFDPKFQEQQNTLVQQVEAIEKIAQSAILHADQAVKQTNTSMENLALFKEQVESLSSIAYDAKSQAVSAQKELDILKQQLDFAKSEAESAKKDALFAKVTSILAIIISIVIPILTQ